MPDTYWAVFLHRTYSNRKKDTHKFPFGTLKFRLYHDGVPRIFYGRIQSIQDVLKNKNGNYIPTEVKRGKTELLMFVDFW